MRQPCSLLEALKKEENHFLYAEGAVEKLRNRGGIYIFGAGGRAIYLEKYLERRGVQVDGFLVSKSHLSRNASFPYKDRLFCYEDTLEAKRSLTICPGVSQSVLSKDIFQSPSIREVIPLSVGVLDDFLISWDTFEAHARELEWLYGRLADELSATNLIVNLQGRLTGRDIPSRPSGWIDPQYFLSELMQWREWECLMDGGAFTGDTVEEFLQKKGPSVEDYKVYAWEPDPFNFKALQRAYSNDPHIVPLEKGMFSHTGEMRFSTDVEHEGGEASSISEDGNVSVDVATIDEIAGADTVTFIKMDIEGSELEALRGAEQQIRKNRPRLAICLYRKWEDMWTIPQYIASLVPDYKFYLRPHSSMPTELTLFCVPSEA